MASRPIASAPTAHAPMAMAPVAIAPNAMRLGMDGATPHRRNVVDVRVDVRCQFGRLPQMRHRCGMANHRLEIRAASPLSVVGHTHAIDAAANVVPDESCHMRSMRLLGITRVGMQLEGSLSMGWPSTVNFIDERTSVACAPRRQSALGHRHRTIASPTTAPIITERFISELPGYRLASVLRRQGQGPLLDQHALAYHEPPRQRQ